VLKSFTNRSLVFALLCATSLTIWGCPSTTSHIDNPRGVILMIGDGMGYSQISFGRNLHLQPGERFAMESMPVLGSVTTYSSSNWVTDSAAAATAMATGIKISNKRIGLDDIDRELRTLADEAKAQGWRFGYVTNTSITHATPASFYGHVKNRYDPEDLAQLAVQLVEQAPHVALGGGWAEFLPIEESGGKRLDKRNLLDEAKALGYEVLDSTGQLPSELPDRVIGLFGGSHLLFDLDKQGLPAALHPPTLAQLARAGIDVVDRDSRSFFLMIEGGRIDHGGHAFDAATVGAQMKSFDETVGTVLEYQKENPDVLVILTADHATGGLAVNDFSDWDLLRGQRASVDSMVSRVLDEADPAQIDELNELAGYDAFDPARFELIKNAGDKYAIGRAIGTALSERSGVTFVPRVDPWSTAGHTGEDVPLFAVGPGAERFGGMLDNTDIPKRLAEILGWETLNAPLTEPIELPRPDEAE